MKNFKKLRAEEHKLTQAVDAFNNAKQGYTSKKRTYDDVAAKFGVDPSTLHRRVQGKGKSMLEFNAMKQKLTVAEEKVLVKFILESAEIGFSLNHWKIEKHANVILQSKQGLEYKAVGKQWVFNFLNQHHDVLGTHWSKSLDTQHAQSLNPATATSGKQESPLAQLLMLLLLFFLFSFFPYFSFNFFWEKASKEPKDIPSYAQDF